MTSNSNNKQQNLLDQRLALHSYLDDLLQEIPDTNESQSVSVDESEHRKNSGTGNNSDSKGNSDLKNKHGLVRRQEKQVQGQNVQTQTRQRPDIYPVSNPESKPELKQESRQELPQAPKPVMDIPVLRESQQVRVNMPAVETEAKIEADAEVKIETNLETRYKTQPQDENCVPDWAQKRFKCLLFKVAGISLAVPLAKLNGVISWSEKITPMPGHSRSFLGVLRHHETNVKVMDTALIVLPEKQQEGVLLPPEQRLKNVILVDNCNWGLACDGIGEVITLEPDEVRWRTPRGKLKWLAGTVLQHLCALLEVDAFTCLLEEGQKQADN